MVLVELYVGRIDCMGKIKCRSEDMSTIRKQEECRVQVVIELPLTSIPRAASRMQDDVTLNNILKFRHQNLPNSLTTSGQPENHITMLGQSGQTSASDLRAHVRTAQD